MPDQMILLVMEAMTAVITMNQIIMNNIIVNS